MVATIAPPFLYLPIESNLEKGLYGAADVLNLKGEQILYVTCGSSGELSIDQLKIVALQ